jgi:hypothetical protein
MDQQLSSNGNESNKSLNIAYTALFISLVSLGIGGWLLYQEVNKPKTTGEKVDTFFQQQDQEFDKMFDKDTTKDEENQ